MPGRQAKTITAPTLRRMLNYARHTAQPTRSVAIILLSVKAGLRAAEIARLEWSMVLDARGLIGVSICIRDAIAKRRAGRTVPLHPELRRILMRLQRDSDGSGPVVVSARGGKMQPNSIVNWFVVMFRGRLLVAFGATHLYHDGSQKLTQGRL
jgi:integrase